MSYPFPAAILVVAASALYLAHRLGWLRSPAGRWALLGITAVVVAFAFPDRDLELAEIKKTKLLLCCALVLLLILRQARAGWGREPRLYLGFLACLAALSGVVYLGFFSFHGQRTFVHLHDVAHYYLGSKYFPELGYDSLYTAMLRAEAEVYEDRFKVLEARDLTNNAVVDIRVLLRRSHEVKARFSNKRWGEFCRDVVYFREALGPVYANVYTDQGFNATPVWAALGGALSRRVPAGDGRWISLLTVLDPVLIAGLFALVAWAFGRQSLLLGVLYFTLVFGAGFAWTGGAFGRMPWLFGVIGGLCCLRRQRPAWAGALFAGAALLRIFPILFLVGPTASLIEQLFRKRRISVFHRRLFGAFGLTAAALVGLAAVDGSGISTWQAFFENSQRYMERVPSNMVGLTPILALAGHSEGLDAQGFEKLTTRYSTLHRWQLGSIFVLSLIFVAYEGRRRNPTQTAVLGLIPIFCGLNLAGYYYVMLMVLLFVHRSARDRAWIFAGETFAYALMLFDASESQLFVYRSALVASTLIGLYLPASLLHRRR